MSTGVVAAIVVAVLVVIAVVAAVSMSRGAPSTGRLKHRFGPEYDRALAQHDGDAKATRKELSDRVKRYGEIQRRPLSESERERYAERWRNVQAQFVEEPAQALDSADRLVAEVAANRGYPPAGSPEHFDALSVHYGNQLQGYRRTHALAEHASAGGEGATEDLRQSLVSARGLFDELLDTDGKPAVPRTERTEPEGVEPEGADSAEGTEPDQVEPATAERTGEYTDDRTDDGTEPAGSAESTDPDAAAADGPDAGSGRAHQSLGHRFASLTGTVRKDEDRGSDRA
jgi:hypothetical protein